MQRLRFACLALLAPWMAFAMPDWQEPMVFLSMARTQAMSLRPQAELYSIDSETLRDEKPCADAGWSFVFFADVDATVDASGVEKIEVGFTPVTDDKDGCLWRVETKVTHRDRKPWGMLPLETRRAGSVRLVSMTGAAEKYLGGKFEMKTVSIFHPDLDSIPVAGVLLQGNYCGRPTYLQINASTGAVYDAPVKPDCGP